MTSDTTLLASRQLQALLDATWARDMAADPLLATYVGETAHNTAWPDLSPAARAARQAADRDALAQLQTIPRDALPEQEALTHELFEQELQGRLRLQAFFHEAYAITAREGPQSLNELAELMPLDTPADVQVWLRRLQGLPGYLAQFQALLAEAVARGHTQPRFLMERVLAPLDAQLVDDPTASPFFSAFHALPAAWPEAEALRAAAIAVIREQVVPAYRRFRAFFAEDYLGACRESHGIWDSPQGEAYYANRIAHHTSTPLSAQDIHQIGLAEVARIQDEMQAVMASLDFEGSLQDFFEWLRTDPRFYAPDADSLFAAYVLACKRIDPELPKLFGTLPRTPYGVRPIPDTSAPNTTAAYYAGPSEDGRRAGYYYVNLYRPEMRPLYEVEVLTTHEAVPGHHLQIALAQEQGALPKFRRFAAYNGYLEGWALYAERLGYELGLYRDPFSHFGQLTYDMWRAVRLVVDTGIHAMRWTREEAIDYFRAHAAKSEVDIVNEIDRYIGWPAQALSYKIGQLHLLALRSRAEQALGARFDLRAFHDAVLAGGAVPLDMLARRIDDWIRRQG
ncbi:DUF885 domain-containing protein [Pelomonas sp. APW6]|uniref:DUF885 domain-containing protein n=1 Tax=Roseateles subflavus TaxID=3053353 RepID=A0ABT7LDK4_9BURK|nr:DUF885 domain-containing protein [Pelomonas sp. APW6]MDL5030938.1 DUF885 domain-containing protein [Pelomonas sp. APW6]